MYEAEVVTRRIVAEKPPGSKSPRSGDDDDAGGEAKRARGARGGAAKKDTNTEQMDVRDLDLDRLKGALPVGRGWLFI